MFVISHRHPDLTRKANCILNQITSLQRKVTGINQSSLDLEDNDDLIICQDLTTTQNGQISVLINNFSEHRCTLKEGCNIAILSIRTPEQAKDIKPINAAQIRHF